MAIAKIYILVIIPHSRSRPVRVSLKEMLKMKKYALKQTLTAAEMLKRLSIPEQQETTGWNSISPMQNAQVKAEDLAAHAEQFVKNSF